MTDERPSAGGSPGGDGAERKSEADGAGHTARRPGFFEVVLAQRACRRFADRPVGEELLERCLQAAVHAPSAENCQPWVFVVVRDPATRAALADLTRRAWRAGGRRHSEGRLSARLLAEVEEGAESGLAQAPVVVVVGGDASLGVEATLPSSVFPAVQNLLLAATALGLGSTMTTLATAFPDDLRELLGLPAPVRPMAVVPLGWPASPLGPPRRLPLSERAHRDRYGRHW